MVVFTVIYYHYLPPFLSIDTLLLSPYTNIIYTKILEVNLFAFAYRLLHEDFSPINGALP